MACVTRSFAAWKRDYGAVAMAADLRVVVDREMPEEAPDEDEPFDPLLQATVWLCYVLMLVAVLSVVVYEIARLAGG
jgi:hypothetical protein